METKTSKQYAAILYGCKVLAAELKTMVEIREYPQYGWTSVAFMTDKFGGVYTHIHIDMQTCEMTKDYGSGDAVVIPDMMALARTVCADLQQMLRERNLERIAEEINEQY